MVSKDQFTFKNGSLKIFVINIVSKMTFKSNLVLQEKFKDDAGVKTSLRMKILLEKKSKNHLR